MKESKAALLIAYTHTHIIVWYLKKTAFFIRTWCTNSSKIVKIVLSNTIYCVSCHNHGKSFM